MARRGRPPYRDILTPREFEVLELLRAGLSNEEIAERLGISLSGAKYHVSEILGKLGVGSREEAARWRPEGRRWWSLAVAPMGRHPWAAWGAVGVAGLAVAAGVVLLVWGLVRNGDGGEGAVFAPTADASATTSAPGGSCGVPQTDESTGVIVQRAIAPDVAGLGPVGIATLRSEPLETPWTFVYWCTETLDVDLQRFPPWAPRFGCRDCAVIDARQQVVDGVRELAVVYDTVAFGSGSPDIALALLRLEGGSWTVVWDSGEAEGWRGSHGRAEFAEGDLSRVVVRSDSWGSGSDELTRVFHEANAGPHRLFADTWVREGDAYARASAETVASPYATIVQFVYALSVNDDEDAAAWVTEQELIGEAREAGLHEAPGRGWLLTCDPTTSCGESAPLRFYEGAGPAVAVSFVQRDGDWLISAIDAAPNEPFP